jgi:hypothetical protein
MINKREYINEERKKEWGRMKKIGRVKGNERNERGVKGKSGFV